MTQATSAGSIIDKMCERLLGHHVIWKLTACMSENVYCILVQANRAENHSTTFSQMQSQGNMAYIVLFGDSYQEISKDLFFYLKDCLERDMKRNDERQGNILLSEEESLKINYDQVNKQTKKRKVTHGNMKVSQPDFSKEVY